MLESVICGDTGINSADLRIMMKKMSRANSKDNVVTFETQFKASNIAIGLGMLEVYFYSPCVHNLYYLLLYVLYYITLCMGSLFSLQAYVAIFLHNFHMFPKTSKHKKHSGFGSIAKDYLWH